MKLHILISFFSLFLFSSLIYCQSIGFSAGYGFLNMNEVNKDLEDSRNLLLSLGVYPSSPVEVTGGLFTEGNFKYDIGNIILGITGNYISSSGNFSYSDNYGSFEHNLDASTIEILALVEILIQKENSSFRPFFQIAGGIGLAKAERLIDYRYYSDPSFNFSIKNTVDGNYFAARMKGGLQIVLQNTILELAVGYRIANAGDLKGDYVDTVDTGASFEDVSVRDSNGNDIEFDYSGFLITGGISIVIQ